MRKVTVACALDGPRLIWQQWRRLVGTLLDALVPLLPLEEASAAARAAQRRGRGCGGGCSEQYCAHARRSAAAAAEARAAGTSWSLSRELRELGARGITPPIIWRRAACPACKSLGAAL
jgi:hypothetical protein